MAKNIRTNPLLTSTQNPRIKKLLSLEKARERRKQGLFVMEGLKELELALKGDYEPEGVFYHTGLVREDQLLKLGLKESQLIPVSNAVFEKLAYRETTGGVITIAKQKTHTLTTLVLPKQNPLILVLEGVEKPGNLGAILRTADAAAVDAVIICDPLTDFYNPNVVRSSVGCLFTTQVASATSEETIQWLRKKGMKIFSTYLEGAVRYDKPDYKQPCAIVMGSEATGLTPLWVKEADECIVIPMRGKIDSMNVSVAAAVVVFEAMRQRGFN